MERKKLLLLITIVLLAVFSLYFVFIKAKKESPPKKSSLSSPTLTPPSLEKQLTMRIGNDSFSQEDLEYLASIYQPNKNLSELTVDEKEYLEDLALERSLVIQEAQKREVVSVDETLFAPNKGWNDYNRTYEEAKQAIIAQEEQITVAGIFIYFYNQFPPEMGVERAKELARKKMEELRERLIKGEISLKQAGEIIANDTSLAEIDPIYDANAYSEFNKRNKTRQIVGGITSQDNNLLWSLDVGDYSPIILGFESGNEVAPNEAYWAIFQVTSKTGSGKPYLEWLKEAKKEYESKNH